MKWHHKFAYGDEKEEHWRDLGPCKTMEEAASLAEEECAEMSREYEWSDKYRGIAYEIVKAPPVEVLRGLVEAADRLSRQWARRKQELLDLELKQAVTQFFTSPEPIQATNPQVGSIWWEERDGWRLPWRVTSSDPPMGYPCGDPVEVKDG